ncbi:general amino acid permease GAP1, partial [Schizosaccharomyces japonicus yFS275]
VNEVTTLAYGEIEPIEEKKNAFCQFLYSFKRANDTENFSLKRRLKSRHIQMIAIGGTIGTGLWVGSGKSLYKGGGGSVILNYALVGSAVLTTVYSLGELCVNYPVPGGYFTLASRFIDESWGFALNWLYVIGAIVNIPLELTTACMCLNYWTSINSGIWVTLFILFFLFINVFGVKGYGEIEFFMSTIKVIAVVSFIILGIVIDCGGIPTDHRGYIGTKIFEETAFLHGFHGFCAVFLSASYSYAGTEYVGLAAAETEDPKKSFPKAVKQTVYRIFIFYVLALFIVALLISGNDKRLRALSGTMASPFVLAIKDANIRALPSILNAIILISVLSAANAMFYVGSRAIHSVGAHGHGPKWFTYVDCAGRPLAAYAILFCFSCLAYLNESKQKSTIFDWLMSVSGLNTLFNWGSINLTHIRLRIAMKKQLFNVKRLAYWSPFGISGSVYGLFWCIVMMIAQFYVAIFPFGGNPSIGVLLSGVLIRACHDSSLRRS